MTSLLLSCNNCKNWEKLQACSNCKTARYCSKECQKQDWELHKSACKLYTDSNTVESKLQRYLRLWIARFHVSLTHAIVPALELQKNPTNIDNFGMIIHLQPRKHRESGSRFTLQSATIVPMAQLKLLYEGAAGGNAILQEHARQRAALQKKSAAREDYATIVVIAQNTGPGNRLDVEMSFTPISLTRSFIQNPRFSDPTLAWRETLMVQVENNTPNR
ncbi:hypothetical protein BT96DRAFT_916292 [Gymnopus androsaceus JB14]|uniref:MYND-type domain-containing protein n=1 Tax=Gymnopus androsaceus JB14 TaxID=1447944 RepID=A0A6A4I8H5_9AGAR|nr:hypothetical protein BT96DRAFT_916292 [Gymnopus androsaceus JB14]